MARPNHSARLCLIIGALSGLVILGIILVDRCSSAPSRPAARSWTGAFVHGGKPETSPVMDALCRESLPAWVIALDAWRKRGSPRDDQELGAARERVLTAWSGKDPPAHPDQASAPVMGHALHRVVHALERAAGAPDPELDAAADALKTAMLELDRALMQAGLGYMLDSDVISQDGERVVLAFCFAVTHVNVYAAEGQIIPALHVERLDALNWEYRLLGFTTAERREVLILLTQIEDRLVSEILPLLAEPALAFLAGDDRAPDSEWYAALAGRAALVARREYGGRAAARVGELLARRARLFQAWNQRLSPSRVSLRMPRSLLLGWEPASVLEGHVSGLEIAELGAIETELAGDEAARAFATARDLLLASVERHELQHRLDQWHTEVSGRAMPLPPALQAFVGPLRDPEGNPRPTAWRSQAELSAYLAELARDPHTLGTNLGVLAQFLIVPEHRASAECYAAVVIFEELARTLGIEGLPLVMAGEIDHARVTRVYLALTDVPPARLRHAARALWEAWFGRPLPELVKIAPGPRQGNEEALRAPIMKRRAPRPSAR